MEQDQKIEQVATSEMGAKILEQWEEMKEILERKEDFSERYYKELTDPFKTNLNVIMHVANVISVIPPKRVPFLRILANSKDLQGWGVSLDEIAQKGHSMVDFKILSEEQFKEIQTAAQYLKNYFPR